MQAKYGHKKGQPAKLANIRRLFQMEVAAKMGNISQSAKHSGKFFHLALLGEHTVESVTECFARLIYEVSRHGGRAKG